MRLAASIVFDHQYSRAGGPEMYRPPGYPLFLVPGVISGHDILVTVVMQALLGGVTVWLTYLIARKLFASSVALACAALAAFEPGLIVWSDKIMAETLLTMAVTATVLALVEYLDTGRRRWMVRAGALTAAAAYVKPVAYFLPLWVPVMLVFAVRPPRRFSAAAIYLLVAAALLAPWQIRNGVRGGYYGFSTQVDGILALSAPAAVTAERKGTSFLDERRRVDQYGSTGPVRDPSYADARRRGIATLFSSPITYARIHLGGMFRTLVDPGALPYLELFALRNPLLGISRVVSDRGSIVAFARAFSEDPLVFWSVAAMSLITLSYLALAIAGVWRCRGTWTPPHVLLLSVVAYFVLVSGGPWGQSRFRVPIMPVMCVLAGYSRDR